MCPIIYNHHERIDGKGYPQGIKGDKIPHLAKVLTICDSFDAIVSKRPYKEATSIEYGIGQIEAAIGKQFDKNLSKEFIQLLNNEQDEVQKILHRYDV